VVELAVGTSIALLVMAMVYGFWAGASRSTGRSVEHSDALRSVLIASEFIRHDVSQMLYQWPSRDMAIFAGQTALGLRVPGRLDPADFWSKENNVFDPVTYTLQLVPGSRNVFRLIRKDLGGPSPLRACLLGGLHFEKIGPGVVSQDQAYLQVTMVGVGSEKPSAFFTSSMLIPLTPMYPPVPYRLGPQGRVQ
jgi:hypothetical protein